MRSLRPYIIHVMCVSEILIIPHTPRPGRHHKFTHHHLRARVTHHHHHLYRHLPASIPHTCPPAPPTLPKPAGGSSETPAWNKSETNTKPATTQPSYCQPLPAPSATCTVKSPCAQGWGWTSPSQASLPRTTSSSPSAATAPPRPQPHQHAATAPPQPQPHRHAATAPPQPHRRAATAPREPGQPIPATCAPIPATLHPIPATLYPFCTPMPSCVKDCLQP